MTTRIQRRRTLVGLGGALLAATLVVSGCTNASTSSSGGGGGGSSALPSFDASSVKQDSAIAAMVPSSVKKKGTLTVGSDTSYAPNEFIAGDGKTIVGMDVDLGSALAAKMGLKVKFQTADFASILPSLGTRYDLGMSSFTINADRLKAVDLISYYSAGTSWAIKKGGASFDIGTDSTAVCGKKVAVQTGTVQADDDLPARNKKCKSAGKQEIAIQSYKDQTSATTAVAGGKADAMLADSPVTGYAVKTTGGSITQLGKVYEAAPYGIALPKDSSLDKAMLAALKSLMSDGTYKKILTNWNAQSGAITDPAVNPSVSG